MSVEKRSVKVATVVMSAQIVEVRAIPLVKFHLPLLPAEPFEVRFESAGEDRYRFRVVRRDALVASGSIEVAPHAFDRQ